MFDMPLKPTKPKYIYIFYIMFKEDLALINQQRLICHKKTTKPKLYIYI